MALASMCRTRDCDHAGALDKIKRTVYIQPTVIAEATEVTNSSNALLFFSQKNARYLVVLTLRRSDGVTPVHCISAQVQKSYSVRPQPLCRSLTFAGDIVVRRHRVLRTRSTSPRRACYVLCQ